MANSTPDPQPHWPRLLAAFEPLPGRIKLDYSDFHVLEEPLYPADGTGTHLFFRVEKTGLSTQAAIRDLARALGVPPHALGYAGQKDARAVVQQWFSVEHIPPQRLEELTMPRLRVLEVHRHGNKLRLGHLRGNRFVIRVRQTRPDRLNELQTALAELARRGVPNYFGPQRFGLRGDNALIGRALLHDEVDEALDRLLGRPGPLDRDTMQTARRAYEAGDYAAAAAAWPPLFRTERQALRVLQQTGGNKRRALASLDRRARDFLIAAYQSHVFNQVVAARLPHGLERLLPGDLAYRHASHNVFRVEDPEREQPRADALEISPSGPLFGPRLSRPGGPAAEIEDPVWAVEGLDESRWRHPLLRGLGSRRPLRFPVHEAVADSGADDRGAFIELRFFLPRGCYATAVLRELFDESLARAAEEPGADG